MIIFFKEARRVLSLGNFNLKQWSSNSPKLMDLARSEGVAEEDPRVKVLGLS